MFLSDHCVSKLLVVLNFYKREAHEVDRISFVILRDAVKPKETLGGCPRNVPWFKRWSELAAFLRANPR